MEAFMALSAPFLWLLLKVLDIYTWIVIASVACSWLIAFNVINVRHPLTRQIVHILDRLTSPILRKIQNVLPPIGGLDLSPLVLILGILVLKRLIIVMWTSSFMM